MTYDSTKYELEQWHKNVEALQFVSSRTCMQTQVIKSDIKKSKYFTQCFLNLIFVWWQLSPRVQ